MNLIHRRILTLIFFLLFSGFSFLGVLYASGYKFDFSNFKFYPTGGVYITNIKPKNSLVISLWKNKFKIKSQPIFLDYILPGEYQLKIQKKGYFPYVQDIKIEKGKILYLKDIILIPKNLEMVDILKIDSFFKYKSEIIYTIDGELFLINGKTIKKLNFPQQIRKINFYNKEYIIINNNELVELSSNHRFRYNFKNFKNLIRIKDYLFILLDKEILKFNLSKWRIEKKFLISSKDKFLNFKKPEFYKIFLKGNNIVFSNKKNIYKIPIKQDFDEILDYTVNYPDLILVFKKTKSIYIGRFKID